MLAILAVLAASAAVRSSSEQALRAPASDKDHATQDAAAVLASLLTVLEGEAKTEGALDEQFAGWCADAQSARDLLRDEVDRRIRETETSLAQLAADEQRLRSEVGLSGAAQNATAAQFASTATTQDALGTDVANELDLLARATELTRHALRLANTHATPSEDTEGEEAPRSGLTDTLSTLMEELDLQKQQVVDERDKLVEQRANLTDEAHAAGAFLTEASTTITVEGRERSRAAARYASELADLRRLVGAAGEAANATQEVCAAQRNAVREHDGVTAAEIDSVRASLESLGPDEVLSASFLQVRAHPVLEALESAATAAFQPKAELVSPAFLQSKDSSGIDKFTAFVVRQAKLDPHSAFAKAAASLSVKQPEQQQDKTSNSDPLAEIAAFGDSGDADQSADNERVSKTYEALEGDLQTKLTETKHQSALCADATGHAQTAVERMGEEKSFADAKLAVLNATAKELDMQEDYLQGQTTGVNETTDALKHRVHEEKELAKKATDKLQGFAQQLVSVSAGLSRVGSSGNGLRKVAKEVERLVERVEGHVSYLAKRSEQYASWEERVDASSASLSRVLQVDLSHARRKSNEYATERAYTESMDAAKARDAVEASDDEDDAKADCPPAKVEAQQQQQAALVQQLHELHVLWGSLRI